MIHEKCSYGNNIDAGFSTAHCDMLILISENFKLCLTNTA